MRPPTVPQLMFAAAVLRTRAGEVQRAAFPSPLDADDMRAVADWCEHTAIEQRRRTLPLVDRVRIAWSVWRGEGRQP